MFIKIIFTNDEGEVLASNGVAKYDESVDYDQKVYELAIQAEDRQNAIDKANEYDADYQAQVDTGYDDTSADN